MPVRVASHVNESQGLCRDGFVAARDGVAGAHLGLLTRPIGARKTRFLFGAGGRTWTPAQWIQREHATEHPAHREPAEGESEQVVPAQPPPRVGGPATQAERD